jgi:hypothetical protein
MAVTSGAGADQQFGAWGVAGIRFEYVSKS